MKAALIKSSSGGLWMLNRSYSFITDSVLGDEECDQEFIAHESLSHSIVRPIHTHLESQPHKHTGKIAFIVLG